MRNLEICHTRQAELRHDQTCETAQEVREALVDQEVDEILLNAAYGEHDADLADYFDAKILMRIARLMATKDFELAFSLVAGDLIDIRTGIKDYARNLAETRVD